MWIWINKRLFSKRTIVFVPLLYLLSQLYIDWIKQSSAEKCQIKYLLIGSDMDVGEDTVYKANGLMLTTNPKEIKRLVK